MKFLAVLSTLVSMGGALSAATYHFEESGAGLTLDGESAVFDMTLGSQNTLIVSSRDLTSDDPITFAMLMQPDSRISFRRVQDGNPYPLYVNTPSIYGEQSKYFYSHGTADHFFYAYNSYTCRDLGEGCFETPHTIGFSSYLRARGEAWMTDPSLYSAVYSVTVTTIPTPASLGLLLSGLGAVLGLRRFSRS